MLGKILPKPLERILMNISLIKGHHYYDAIMIVFEDDERAAHPKYVFNDGFCDLLPCKFEYRKGKTIVIE